MRKPREDEIQWEGKTHDSIERREKLTPGEFQRRQDELAQIIRIYIEENTTEDQNDCYKSNI